MKKTSLIFALGALVTVSAFAGSGTVNFNNASPVSKPIWDQGGVGTGNKLAGTGYKAVLYGGPQGTAEGSLVLLDDALTFRTGGAAGFVDTASDAGGSTRTVTGLTEDGGMATFQVRAWDVSTGATWDTATRRGVSNLFDVDTAHPGDAQTPPGTPSALIGMQEFALVPEPATITLSLLGASGLLAFRRRKS